MFLLFLWGGGGKGGLGLRGFEGLGLFGLGGFSAPGLRVEYTGLRPMGASLLRLWGWWGCWGL